MCKELQTNIYIANNKYHHPKIIHLHRLVAKMKTFALTSIPIRILILPLTSKCLKQ